MSNAVTKRMLPAYLQMAPVTMFLSSFFQTPEINYHNTETVEVDIMRNDEDVAIAIVDLSTGSRQNFADLYTNKEFKPPIFDEEISISSFDLIKREVGQNPFENPSYAANMVSRLFRGLVLVDNKIRRAIELMAAQVLQTATLTLRDQAGNALYTLDFGGRNSQFPTVTVSWGDSGDTPLQDLEALAEEIRTNHKGDPDVLLFGKSAWANFIGNADVKEALDLRRDERAFVRPESRGAGATYQGAIWIGNYRFEMWTYNGRYKDPQSGDSLNYLDADKVVMLDSQARRDRTYGTIPRLVGMDPRLASFIPERLSDPESGTDLSVFAYITPDGKQAKASAGTRPLVIPTAIDSFGCLTTVAPE